MNEKEAEIRQEIEEKEMLCNQETLLHKEIDTAIQCEGEIVRCQTEAYEHLATDSFANNSSNTLLLPSVVVPDNSLLKLPLSSLSGVESVRVVSYIQNIQEKATKAICLAQHYRNVAENIGSETKKRDRN